MNKSVIRAIAWFVHKLWRFQDTFLRLSVLIIKVKIILWYDLSQLLSTYDIFLDWCDKWKFVKYHCHFLIIYYPAKYKWLKWIYKTTDRLNLKKSLLYFMFTCAERVPGPWLMSLCNLGLWYGQQQVFEKVVIWELILE